MKACTATTYGVSDIEPAEPAEPVEDALCAKNHRY
jgi:hypothetical protein